jgi:Family of unknown function (DUF6516)
MIKFINYSARLPKKSGNGIIKVWYKVNSKGKLRYSLAYINFRLCGIDNGRVLGYDNNHGYHHRHYLGKEEPYEFVSYDDTSERFEIEWRKLHEQAKKHFD